MALLQENVKSCLIRDKAFLKSLYEGNLLENRKILSVANDTELDTVLKYLHFLSNGQVSYYSYFNVF